MKLLFRIAAIAAFASTLLAGGDALADGRGHDRDRDRREWRQPQREWRQPQRDWREDRDPRAGGRWQERAPQGYAVPGPGYGPGYGRRPPPPNYGLRRGGLVPPEYRGAVVPDYGRLRLRPPPPGFAWVRMGGRYMLVSRETGQIFDVIGD
jgi:Ni/Co efflux regulator RcnB